MRLLLPEDYTSKCYFGIFTFYLSESRQMIFRNVWKKRGPFSLKSAFIHQQQTRAAKKEILIHLISSTKCPPVLNFSFVNFWCQSSSAWLLPPWGSTYSINGERLEQLAVSCTIAVSTFWFWWEKNYKNLFNIVLFYYNIPWLNWILY